MRIDAFCVIGSQWHLSGIEEIKRGGLDISGGLGARLKARLFLACRILLSVALAQLTAVFVSILIFQTAVSARTQFLYQRANAHLIADATALVDGSIRRETQAVAAESEQAGALARQVTNLRQNEVDPTSTPETQQAQLEVTQGLARKAKADEALRAAQIFAANELGGIKGAEDNSGLPGNGPRHMAALEEVRDARQYVAESARALDAARARLDALRAKAGVAGETTAQQSRAQLPAFVGALAAENRKLAAMKAELGDLIRRRDDAIRAAVDHAPDHVTLDNGLLAQVSALEYVAQANPRAAIVIGLIDVISFGFELAAVLSMVTSFIPTTYAALIARDAYLRAVHMADEIAREVDLISNLPTIQFPSPGKPSDDRGPGPQQTPGPAGGHDDPPQPPKRPRGRPRKHPLN